MKLSAFGTKFSGNSGIVTLMDDLGVALNENPDALFMGGGNPARIDAVENVFQKHLQTILADPEQRHSMLGIYQSPQGDVPFRQDMARFLKRQFGWNVGPENVSVANGSQSAFFLIYNMLAGNMPDDSRRRIHLPLSPEYLGYADAGLSEPFFSATRPDIELLDEQQFKYRVNFSELTIEPDVAALCVSRPTNPTGNVLTDQEMQQLGQLAADRGVPFIVDGAYGLPFPNILFNDAAPHWDENTIMVFSLSKLGLPGARTGIVVANEEFSRAFSNANTIASLASCTLGPAIARKLLVDDEILTLSDQYIRPFYRDRASQCVSWLQQFMGSDLPYRVHKPEGAIFLWLWFEGLPISSEQLYQRLKKRGVLVVPGEPFFVGIDNEWRHRQECIRVSYAQDENTVERGLRLIAEEVRLAYTED